MFRILVVDDDKNTRLLFRTILEKANYTVFVAKNGDQVCPAKWQPGAETLKPSLDLVGLL